ncbi:MAG: hypothetical protein OHK0045_13780 [Raineya sp.]
MNWGTKIALSLGAFITFILVLSAIMMYKNKEEVDRNYYEKDLLYEQEIQAQKNANALSEQLTFELSGSKLLIKYPQEVKKCVGRVLLLRPDDNEKDKILPMQIDENNKQSIDISLLQRGLWKVQVFWEMNGKPYQSKKYDFFVSF